MRKDEKDFKYFSHTLLEHNDKIKRIAFVGGDRDMTQQSFLSPLTRCTFFHCKKHVEDDISRKSDDLGLKDIKNEVLLDIFGSDKCKEKGIVDSLDEEEFIAKGDSLVEKHGKSDLPGENSQVCRLFSSSHRRRYEGWHASFHEEEAWLKRQIAAISSTNLKSKKQKCQTTLVTVLNLKCMRTEVLVMYRKLVEEASREKQMAVLQKGSFVLSEQYRLLQVSLNKWFEKTLKQKQSHLAKVDVSAKENPTVALSLEDDQAIFFLIFKIFKIFKYFNF